MDNDSKRHHECSCMLELFMYGREAALKKQKTVE